MWVVVPNLAVYGTYPTATQDSAGTPLESHLDDQLVFSTSGLPPIEETGFCSLTAYRDDQSVVDNNPRSNTYNLSGATDADQVYALGSVQLPGSKRSPLRLSSDASTTLKRCLPLPNPEESPNFNAMLRLYEPTSGDRRRQPSILRQLQPSIRFYGAARRSLISMRICFSLTKNERSSAQLKTYLHLSIQKSWLS